ncbi:MAG: hypothetical protein JNL96_15980 [Planctomycetaceae bacterium]|nr:hypothetical protein [Planctomycetaceae bacterium]
MNVIDLEEFGDTSAKMIADCVLSGKSLYEGLQQHVAQVHRGRQLSIAIIDTQEVNARAYSQGQIDVIEINLGLIQKIYGTMHGLMSLPYFLPNVGDVAKEVMPEIADSEFCGYPMKTKDFDDPTFGAFFFPQDQTRCTFAMTLANYAMDFVVFHELGHIFGGHCELLNASRGMTSISEFSAEHAETEIDVLRHLLECDADAFAAHFPAEVASLEDSSESLVQLFGDCGWEKQDVSISIFLVAVAATFRLLYPNASFANCRGSRCHPHPAVRSMVVGSSALSQVSPYSDGAARVVRVLPKSAVQVERAWQQAFLAGTPNQLKDADLTDLADVSTVLFDSYLKFRDVFSKYARVPRNWDRWATNAGQSN